ncbi:hypothetical protein DFH06DRAFT_1176916 [Mycena polygramma]|nr:hypothetical protein DFH06DRAFT_1176916 [Mycena polygramma]
MYRSPTYESDHFWQTACIFFIQHSFVAAWDGQGMSDPSSVPLACQNEDSAIPLIFHLVIPLFLVTIMKM